MSDTEIILQIVGERLSLISVKSNQDSANFHNDSALTSRLQFVVPPITSNQVRLNNVINRNLHLQHAITVDQSMHDKEDVIFDPNSLTNGSDARGGIEDYKVDF